MSYSLHKEKKLNASVKKIVTQQIENAVESLQSTRDASSEGIHEARKSFKKIRAILRLVRPAIKGRYKQGNSIYRSFGHRLSDWRDAKVVIATLEELQKTFSERIKMHFFSSARKALEAHFDPVMSDIVRLRITVEELTTSLAEQKKKWGEMPLTISVDDITGGAQRTYGKARKARLVAYEQPSGLNFHQWRKYVKYHWYHLRLLKDIWPPVMNAFIAQAHSLGDMLGSEHDLTILHDSLTGMDQRQFAPADLDILLELIDIQQQKLRRQAQGLGIRLFSSTPGDFRQRLSSCIYACQMEDEVRW
ncbi:MAG: CHAD domain-containing protein [Chitinivibrionales bacterium]